MTGDGPTVPFGETLLVLGTSPDGPGGAAADLLASADAVFAGGPDPETVALFYAEAWRVERIRPDGAAARLDEWFRLRPGGTAALVVAGPVDRDVAFAAAVDGLRLLRPGLRIDRRAGVRVTPPHRDPLAH